MIIYTLYLSTDNLSKIYLHFQTYLCGGNTVDKTDLLESLLTQSNGDFPSFISHFMADLQWHIVVINFVLCVKIYIIFEVFNLKHI